MSNIWSKTVCHDPYANHSTKERPPQHQNDKVKGLLEFVRHEKIAGDTTSRNDFVLKLYVGLKGGKKWRTELLDPQKTR